MTRNYKQVLAVPLFSLLLLSCPSALPAGVSDTKDSKPQPPALVADASKSGQASAGTISAGKLTQASTEFTIDAPLNTVWKALTDFPKYPRIFSRIKSCQITRQQGSLIWTQSDLKPHFFIRKLTNQTVNDLTGAPYVLNWQLVQGSFNQVHGCWKLESADNGRRCHVRYTLAVDTGEVIPACLVSLLLRTVENEATRQLKGWIENEAGNRGVAAGEEPQAAGQIN